MQNQKRRKLTKIDRILDLPKEVVSDMPKFTITGFEEIVIENYKGILEYEEIFIKVNTYIGAINITGFNLNLKQLTEDNILVKGKIESIEFESAIDE